MRTRNKTRITRRNVVAALVASACIATILFCVVMMLAPISAHAETLTPETVPERSGVGREDVLAMKERQQVAEEMEEELAAERELRAAESKPTIIEKVPTGLNEVETSIYSALRESGLTKAGTAAVMGCMSMESGLCPWAENPSDGGYGLLQWTSSRRDDLFSWCSAHGLDATSAYGQVEFFIYELEKTYSRAHGHAWPVYETLTTSHDLEECLKMFFSHAEAGTNVTISSSNVYCAGLTTAELYSARLQAARKYM